MYFYILEKTYKLFNDKYKYLKPMFDMSIYSIIFHIRDKNISILSKDNELKIYFYNQVKKLTDNMSVQKEYEKYFSWFGFDKTNFDKIRKSNSIQDFDNIFNINDFNGCLFKLKKILKKIL